MKQNVFFLQMLTLLFVVSGIRGCGGNIEPLPNLSTNNESVEQLDASNEKVELPTLGEQWNGHLAILESRKEQQTKFKKSVLSFQEGAKKDLLLIINTVPKGRSRTEFVEDLSSFSLQEVKQLITILVHLYRKDNQLILNIVKTEGRVSLWEKIRFSRLAKKLSKDNKKLLDRLIAELKIPNR